MNKRILSILILLVLFSASGVAQKKAEQIAAGVVNGKAISLPKPEYPAAAAAVKASGSVHVSVVIDKEGNVTSATAVSGHPLLRSAAAAAAREAKFSATLISGAPVKVSGVIVYNFAPAAEGEDLEKSAEESDTEVIGVFSMIQMMNVMNADSRFAEIIEGLFEELGNDSEPGDDAKLAKLFGELPGASKERRAEIIEKVISEYRLELTGDEPWQADIGEVLGFLIAEAMARKQEYVHNVQTYKTNLKKLGDLYFSAPASFPRNVGSQFENLIKFGNDANLESTDDLNKIDEMIMAIADTLLE